MPAPDTTTLQRLHRTASEDFGFSTLHPGQEQAMSALLAGRDVLVVMPPGSGKSAVYQVPGAVLGGLTIVVSPLLALQRDQAAGLASRPHARPVAVLNSTLSPQQHAEVLARAASGDLGYLYVGPEQLMRADVLAALSAAGPRLIAVDEAHCISQWGREFRPDYLRLAPIVEALGRPPVAALTATASPPVRSEIIERLRLEEPVVVLRGFDRPEIHLTVTQPLPDAAAKRSFIIEQAAGLPKPLLIYVATRRETSDLAEELSTLGLSAAAYHGTLPAAQRAAVERRWLAGDVDVLVATNAFGMGVDKPDVRAVVHADPPESLDAYLQEIGRAARDGDPAEALLVWRPEDLGVRRFFAGGKPARTGLQRAAATVAAAGRPVTEADLAHELDWSRSRTVRTVDLLLQAGVLRAAVPVEADGQTWLEAAPDAPEPVKAAEAALAVAAERHTVEESRVDMVRAFAETAGCRRQLLLASFGEVLAEPCGNCDRCDAGLPDRDDMDQADSPYPVGGPVQHAQWGPGLVMRYEGDRLVVLFETVGYRTLGLEAIEAHHLLETG